MGPQINVSVHGKVNNINISPINMIGNGTSVVGSNVQSSTSSQSQNRQPFILSEHQAVPVQKPIHQISSQPAQAKLSVGTAAPQLLI